LAIDGKADFVSQTNPFGPSKKRKKTDEQKIADQRALFARMKMDARERIREKKVGTNGQ